MRTAADWLNQVGETVMFSAFAGSSPPGIETENLVKQIQADALWHAAQLVHDLSRGTKSEDRAAAIDEARDLIAEQARNLSPCQSAATKPMRLCHKCGRWNDKTDALPCPHCGQ